MFISSTLTCLTLFIYDLFNENENAMKIAEYNAVMFSLESCELNIVITFKLELMLLTFSQGNFYKND